MKNVPSGYKRTVLPDPHGSPARQAAFRECAGLKENDSLVILSLEEFAGPSDEPDSEALAALDIARHSRSAPLFI